MYALPAVVGKEQMPPSALTGMRASPACSTTVIAGDFHGLTNLTVPPTVERILTLLILPPIWSAETQNPPCASRSVKRASVPAGQAGKIRMTSPTLCSSSSVTRRETATCSDM